MARSGCLRLEFPPYHVYDLRVLAQPHAPLPINLTLAPGGTHSLFHVNWAHNITLDIDPQRPFTFFKYQPPPHPGQQFLPDPIFFRRLRFIQQIQTSTMAMRIHE